jgi:hypothetical protein
VFETKPGAQDKEATARLLRITRALAAGLVTAVAGCSTATEPAPNDIVSDLVIRSETQARLFNTGKMEQWLDVADPAEDFTLMAPFGGPASLGFDRSPEHLAALAEGFKNGDARLELVQTVASEDIVVLVYVERQQLEVYGLPSQDWSLRVTQVFQRRGPIWKLVHRHADPLVHPVSLTTAASLAAGRSEAGERKIEK